MLRSRSFAPRLSGAARSAAWVAACVALGCGSSSSESKENSDAGATLVIPCEACNAYSYTCFAPGVESSTLAIEKMLDAGCTATMGFDPTPRRLQCDPPALCAESGACQPVTFSSGGIQLGNGAQCVSKSKRVP
ncbi:MAG: hypothetical protein U0263_36265 [Polyangiaceae bacterium]